MEVEAKVWALSTDFPNRSCPMAAGGTYEAVNVGSFIEQRGEGVVEDDAEMNIGPRSLEQP